VVTTVADGGTGTSVAPGATLEIDGDPTHSGASLTIPVSETVVLNGAGAGAGALHNVSGNNVWTGNVILATDSTINVDAASRLTVTGTVQDPPGSINLPAPVPASHAGLRKDGSGALFFSRDAAQLRLDLTGSGTFTLSFNAATTSPIQTAGLTASILENAVRTIVPAGATVAVHSIAAGSFGIRLGGSLLGGPAPTLTPGNLTGTVTASVATVALTAPDNTFTGNIAIDEGILNVQSANGLGFNTSTQQDVAVSGTSGSFILDFAGFPDSVNTGPITTAGLTAAKLETALNTMLANALAPGGGTGTARVTTTPSGLSYIVTFGGSLRGSDVALLAVQNLVPNTSINITKILAGGVSNTTVATGSSLQLQSATGFTEASLKPLFISGPGLDNQGALASTGGSNTWGTAPITLVGATTGLGATAGATLIVDRPILDGGNNLGLDKFGAGTVRFTGNQANVYTGLTTVHAGSLELSKGAGVDAIVGDVNVGNDAPTLQVQTLLFGGFQTGDQFTLTYAGNTTAPITFYGNAEFAAAAIQAVLNDPAILGAGNSVTVRPGGTPNSFRVSFGGALAGTNPADLLTGAPVAPATGAINSVISVPGGAPAPNAANLVLLGDEQLSDGAAVVVRADGQFNVNNRTQTAKQVSDLTVTGGTVTTGPAANGGNLAISGNLTATNATLLTPGANAGIVVGGAADIKGGTATFAGDTSGLAVTGSLTFADDLTPAVVNATGANSFLSVGGNARMTGGTIDLSGAGSEFLLSSDASATASVNSPATITGAGTFNLTRPTSATLNTPDGPGGTDLLIQAGIDVAGTAAGIVKSGAGRLELDLNAVETYGSTNILAGDVQVNGGTTIGAVTLNGAAASLSGGGNVGQVTLASGSVNPGANGGASPDFDTLTSTGDTTWNGSTNFNVDLSNGQTAPTAPIAGTDYDVLVVNGNVELGGALLGGTSNVNTRLGDRYTILRTTGAGRITGRFAQLIDGILAVINDGESAFIGGTKYTVRYTNTTVELERTLNNATVTITSSVGGPESKYGQTVTFTATVVPERGAALPPPGSGATVTFVLDRGTINQRTQPPMALDANGQATFDPQLLPNGLWTVGSRHTIDAIFNDATRTFDAPRTATQFVANVVKNTVTISIAAVPSSATAPVYGQQVVITATIAPEEPLGVPGAALPTGEIEFVVDRGTANEQTFRRQVAASAPQTATLTVPQELAALLTPGAHTIDAAYVGSPGARTGDTNYAPTPPLTPASVTINVLTDTTTTTITPVPASSSLGQEAVFQVEVTPGFAGSAGVPVGTLELFEGTIANGPIATEPNYQGGVKTFRIQDLARGVHTIIARFTSANTNYTSSQASISYTVANAVTTTTFVAPTPPLSAAFGTQVTFVVRVDDTPDIAGNTLVPSGTVTFWLDAVNTGVNLGTGTIDPATHQASITTLPNALTPGTHDVIAVYGGDPDFATSQATLSGFLVTGPSTTTLTADTPTTTVFGQAISFTATVTPATGVPAPDAAPTGEVTLLVDGVAHGQPMTLNAQGRATFTITSIPAGSTSHSITARYNGDANYAQSISNAVQAIVNKAGTTTAIAVSLPDAIYGQDAPIQATVQAVGPGAGIPTGTVTFIVDGVPQATPVAVDAAGIARLDLRDLSGGTHKISARYNGDNNFNASTSSEVDQVIRKADLTGQLTSSAATTVFGAPVTFTVTLTPVAPARGVPTGSVIFFFNGVEQPPAPLDANGAASITTAALPVAPSIIRFRYDGDQNFNPVPPTQALSHTVVKGDVGVDLDASVSPSVFGQSVSFTATVTATAPATGVPTGSIVFSIDGVAQPAIALTNGSASFSAPSLASGGRQITAAYQGDANFNPGTAPALTQTVNQASTTTALTGPTNIASGQSATFTATVTPVAPGAGAPTGTVIFNIDGVNQAPVAVGPGGVATFTTATLGSGTHVISAVYSGDTNFLTSSAPALTRTVRPGTSTDLTTSTSTAVFGQTVTLTAVVTGISGLGTPTGTVTFRIDGSDQPPISLAGGRATLFLNRLPPGSHSIVATYSGDGNFAGSSSSALTQVINKANVTATLASSGTSAAGDQVTFTVTVAPAAPATGTPTGNVTFTIDGVAQQPVALNNGVATISVNTLGTGAHSVLAAYAGDGNFNGGNSAPLTQIVNKATLAPVVAASANPTLFGQPVTFTATIGAQAPVATGTVVFNVDGVARPGVPVAAGQATLSLLELSPGVHSISATYLGDANYNSATSAPVSQTVQQASSTVSVSTQGSSVFGQAISLNAFVGPVAPAAGTPSGTVTFLVDGTSIGTVNLNGSGQASLVTSALSAMTHSITAVYNGDANFTGSTGSSSHFVAAATPTVTLISSDPASDAGQDVTFTAMVSSGTAPVSPGGSVSFVINGSVVSTVPVDASGRAVFRMPALRAGGYSVQALYTGAGNFVPANSVTQTQRVSTVTPVITTSVRSTPAGRRFNVTVRYVNSQGELAQSFNGNVSLIARGPGSLVGPVTVAASGGVAFFSGLSGRRAGLYSLRAVADGQAEATGSMTITASRLRIRGRSRQQAGERFSLTIAAIDNAGVVDRRFTGRIALRIFRGPSGGRLRGNVTVRLVRGQVVATGLTVNRAGTYIVRASIGSLTGTFTIRALGGGRRIG
jgi:autotransporter-associated beta strand protein